MERFDVGITTAAPRLARKPMHDEAGKEPADCGKQRNEREGKTSRLERERERLFPGWAERLVSGQSFEKEALRNS
jgi:hypothetical protein